ncbi:uncharacterized protein TRUGW13939_11399 [Talaromyces rugulosus]|uniref:Amidase domain-containing protein n=1 Tax=Talaromyces rugulosus TaxID=121627 RepID=A0A7H8RDC9_TALRU|nr:uncharacterized protein TRUGW13939_11399 [Talaromyces rugulosus]QKX64226.1 hypothetical protein TRUGW13939_11399 [Talaromyces rugulosus]
MNNNQAGRLLSLLCGINWTRQKAVVLNIPRTRDVGFALATIFNFPREEDSTRVTLDWVLKCLKSYQNCNDDVWGTAFLETVVFNVLNIGDKVECTDEVRDYLCRLGSQETLFVSLLELLPDPYSLVGKELRDVWKLVDDSNGTCRTALVPQLDPQAFQLRSTDNQFLAFALPSRIKAKAKAAFLSSPVAGLRVTIKDNIHLKGIKTSVGNPAFFDTYTVRQESAEFIQKLLDGGVSVVGKSKMNSGTMESSRRWL